MRVLPRLAEASPESAWAGKHHGEVCNASLKLLEENRRQMRKGGWVGSQPAAGGRRHQGLG